MEIVHLVIKRLEIQSVVNFRIVKIDDVAYEKFNNLSIYDSIIDKLFKSNNMWNIVLIK